MVLKVIFFLLVILSVTTTLFPITAYAQKEAGASAMPANMAIEEKQDNRVTILKEFLDQYNSPFADKAAVFVREADKNNIDWKLLVAISGVESTFGQQIPYNANNAWGWGIYGDNMIRFSTWDEAITTISKELRERYINKWGAQDVYQIGKYYAASPTWAQRVDYFMQKIDSFALKNPKHLSISL